MSALHYWIWAGLAATLFATARWCVLRTRYYQLGSAIPGPPGLPLLGVIPAAIAHSEHLLEFTGEILAHYYPVCKAWAGPYLIVGLLDPSDISIIVKSSKTMSKPPAYRLLKFIFGSALVSAGIEEWEKYRKVMNPCFSRQIIDTYVSTFYEKSLVLTHLLEKHSGKEQFDIVDYTMKCTLDMVTETSMGVPANTQMEEGPGSVILNFARLSQISPQMFANPLLWFLQIIKHSELYKECRVLVKGIRRYVDCIVNRKIDSLISSRREGTTHNVNDDGTNACEQRPGFLEHMISTMFTQPGLMTKEELRDQAMFVIAAATDTTAYTVGYTLMLLGLHQDVQRRVMIEQEDIFGEDMDRPVTAEDLRKMVYLEQVINETMRLYPAIPAVGRRVDEDVEITGYTLPAGTTVGIPIYYVHRDALYYPEPEKFDPERFNKKSAGSRPQSSFIPFAAGRRMCIGWTYAYASMKTMLSVLLRKYEVLEHGCREDMECLKFEFFLKMVKGNNIKIGPRNMCFSE